MAGHRDGVDPQLAGLRRALCIGGFEVVAAPAWQPVEAVRLRAFELAWD